MEFDARSVAGALRLGTVAGALRLGTVALLLTSLLAASRASAQDATLLVAPPPADCTAVGIAEVSRVLGYTVGEPDEASRSGGICAFSARAATEEGAVSYAIVTAQRLPQRRAFFIAQARRCGSVSPDAPRAAGCKQLASLATVQDIDAYFTARTGTGGATPVEGLGDAAFVTNDALFARRGAAVFEIVVRRGDMLDVPRSMEIAKLLLSRSPAP